MLPMHLMVADGDSETGLLIVWCVVVMAVILTGAWLVRIARRWVSDSPTDRATAGVGFTLGDLRALHRQGKLSNEEFERAKTKVLAAAQRQSARAAQPPAGPKADR